MWIKITDANHINPINCVDCFGDKKHYALSWYEVRNKVLCIPPKDKNMGTWGRNGGLKRKSATKSKMNSPALIIPL